ncbi:MAG: hypothetical protein M3N51_03470 [Actinomycetota bacterium]|nr:hypothetical protein [Actinomycetota bacterium]
MLDRPVLKAQLTPPLALWRLPSTPSLFLLACALSIPVVALNPSALAGDPSIYRERVVDLLGGSLPYLESNFEHLPLAIVPMLAAWLLGGWFGSYAYTASFALLMSGALLGTAIMLDQIGEQLHLRRVGARWLLLAGPLFPLVLFRSDPWSVLLATAAWLAMLSGRRRRAVLWQVLAVLAKGWPVVLSAADWVRGRRRRALFVALTSLALFGVLLAAPGFRGARAFSGIHTDTVVGTTMAVARVLSGEPVGRFDAAGAIYLSAPDWAVLVNASLGIGLAGLALLALRLPVTPMRATKLTGALVVAVLIGSPLFSPQFVLWPTPFLAVHPWRSVRMLTLAVASLTLVFMLGWNPMYEGSLWWLAITNLRNGLLLALGAVTAWSVGHDTRQKRRRSLVGVS